MAKKKEENVNTEENVKETVETETFEDEVEQQAETTEESVESAEAVETDDETTEEDDDMKLKKKDKKDKKDLMIEELTDKYKRTFAEFDNYRKRTDKEKAAMYEIGAKDIIEKILPVVDNFERGLQTVSEEDRSLPFVDGMDKIYKQLIKTLEDAGVKPIEAVGKEFDPNLHNAVMHIDDENFGENIVAEEFQKGYMYRDTVVRHSMVKVAN
ncbi:MAG: nucleotide exchange factor GrpE [Lachnospiraceae bacterium]|nr:nucleotide exchange factor GrpE [Lachnospiraceae bacterium]